MRGMNLHFNSPGFIPRTGKQNGRFCCLPTILQKSPFGSFSKASPQPFIHNVANLSGHNRSSFPACCFNFPMASLILQTSTVRTLICPVTPKWWTFRSTLDCAPYAGVPGKLPIDARHKGHLRSELVESISLFILGLTYESYYVLPRSSVVVI